MISDEFIPQTDKIDVDNPNAEIRVHGVVILKIVVNSLSLLILVWNIDVVCNGIKFMVCIVKTPFLCMYCQTIFFSIQFTIYTNLGNLQMTSGLWKN